MNNAVYVNSISQALITTARRPPKAEDRFCQFYNFFLCRLLVSLFFENRPVPVIFCCDQADQFTGSGLDTCAIRTRKIVHTCDLQHVSFCLRKGQIEWFDPQFDVTLTWKVLSPVCQTFSFVLELQEVG